MTNTVIQLHHGLQQAVAANNSIVKLLVVDNRYFDLNAPANTLFLSNDASLAGVTGTIRHASNHLPVDTFQPVGWVELLRNPSRLLRGNVRHDRVPPQLRSGWMLLLHR